MQFYSQTFVFHTVLILKAFAGPNHFYILYLKIKFILRNNGLKNLSHRMAGTVSEARKHIFIKIASICGMLKNVASGIPRLPFALLYARTYTLWTLNIIHHLHPLNFINEILS